jgi:hypothetical protein
MPERTYGGVTLEEIQQSPRSFGGVSVIEDLCARVTELEARLAEEVTHRLPLIV